MELVWPNKMREHAEYFPFRFRNEILRIVA
jgi:hypothetical protein